MTREVVHSRVALLSMPRTGSTMITRQLSRHPSVFFVGALFSLEGWPGEGPGRRKVRTGLDERWNDLTYRIAHHRELIEHVFAIDPDIPCVGFKHHLSGAREVSEALLDDPRVAKIVVTRSNILACFSSEKTVRLKQSQAEGEAGPSKPLFVGEEFTKYLRIRRGHYAHWQERFEAVAGELRTIEYTLARTPGGMDGLMEFLGLKRLSLPQLTRKRGSDDVTNRFANPEDVVNYLSAHGLQDWSEEEAAN
ncbi:MAG TPA: hypothetical protein VG166_07600 [Caulobacteraceae bacterium]|nr:hypothetical protein [Caulobacteraceae bacterium]